MFGAFGFFPKKPFNPIAMGGMWPLGFPPPQTQPMSQSQPALYGYPTPNNPAPTVNSTPSSGGFVQGERRVSYDPSWSPTLVS